MIPATVQWAVVVITVVSRSALSTIVALLLWSVLPSLVGFQTTTVMSGSMQPSLMVGDAVVVHQVDAAHLARGQVLLFDDPDDLGRLRMHRLMAIRPDGRLETKGDANRGDDSSTVGMNALHGAAFLRIPFAGYPNYWLRTGQPLPLVGCGAVMLLLLAGVRSGRLLEDVDARDRRVRRRHRGTRLPGLHRAATAGAVLLLLSSTAVAPPPAAQAAYSATTAPPSNNWSTMCGDVAPNTGATPSLYYGWGAGSTSTAVTDESTTADNGTVRSGAARVPCTNGWSPYASFDGVTGLVTASKVRNHPTTATVATWFRVNPTDAGGVLAVFGASSGAGSSGNGVDDGLYMSNDGTLSFGIATVQAVGLIQGGYRYCTTSTGYADGSWHLVVATTGLTGCTITVDAKPATTASTPYTLTVSAGAYQGYWRFGYDNIAYAANAPTRMYFKGALDETQVYDSVVPFSVQTAIFASGHGGTVN